MKEMQIEHLGTVPQTLRTLHPASGRLPPPHLPKLLLVPSHLCELADRNPKDSPEFPSSPRPLCADFNSLVFKGRIGFSGLPPRRVTNLVA